MNQDKTYLLRENKALFDATLDEFSSKPFALASTNEIIKRSSYNKGSFYYRFKDKVEIYIALIDYVYTIQINLFNAKNVDYRQITSKRELTKLLFENLYDLFASNKLYYELIQKIYKEPHEIKKHVNMSSIESLFSRFMKRMKEMDSENSVAPDDTLLLQSIELYYYHFPYGLHFSESKNNIEFLLQHLFQQPLAFINVEQEKPKINLDAIPNNLTFLLSKQPSYDISNHVMNVMSLLEEERVLLQNIRQKLKIRKIDMESIINEGVKKNLRDYSYLYILKNLPFAKTSYHLLTRIQKIMLVMIYETIVGTETMVLQNALTFSNPGNVQLLLDELLPLLAKTCKIVVIERKFHVFPTLLQHLYYVDSKQEIQPFSYLDYHKQIPEYFLIRFQDESGHLKTQKIKKNALKIEQYLKKPLFQLYSVDVIDVKDIKE